MKVLTLNAHSLLDTDTPSARTTLVDFIVSEKPTIIALQEVNQAQTAPLCAPPPCGISLDMPLKEGNFAAELGTLLERAGYPVYWAWAGFKKSWGTLEEGVALMSALPLKNPKVYQLSASADPNQWRTRKAVGASFESIPNVRFFSVQFGWWDDEIEPFAPQFARAQALEKRYPDDTLVFLGDFNIDATKKGEGYDFIRAAGWLDTHVAAKQADGVITAPANIDGWDEGKRSGAYVAEGRRIDYVFSSRPVTVRSSRVCLDGRIEKCVSDHYALLVDIDI